MSPHGPTFDASHLILHPIDSDTVLVVDSFNDHIELCRPEIAWALRLNQEDLSDAELSQYRSVFSLEGWPERAKKKYTDEIQRKRKELPLTFVICPTYDCNMRCVYCYQQFAPGLDRSIMTGADLDRTFAYILRQVETRRKTEPCKKVVIQLFGGEPVQQRLKPLNRRIFEFCRTHRFYLTFTTNGLEIDTHMDLFAPYHGYVGLVAINVDGTRDSHDRRRRFHKGEDNFDRITRNINLLIRLRIPVMVGMNVDRSNLGEVGPFLDFAREQGWADRDRVTLDFARVDDRKFDRKSSTSDLLMESELFEAMLKENEKKPFPKNVQFAFLKTSLPLARHFGLSFRQNEAGRLPNHYCWATSPADDIQYIDRNGNLFRCTYTVGDQKMAVGTIDTGPSFSEWHGHNLFNNPECLRCPLGGYCSGGCRLSTLTAPKRRCEEEMANFTYLLNQVITPAVLRRQSYDETG